MPILREPNQRGVSLIDLPVELILELSSYLPVLGIPSSSSYEPVVTDVSHLASLSRVSRRIRSALLPLLFKSIPITSLRHLYVVDELPDEFLEHCHELNVVMDAHFLRSVIHYQENVMSASPSGSLERSPITSLVSILSRTPRLSQLRLRVKDALAWSTLPLVVAHGISLEEMFMAAFQSSAGGASSQEINLPYAPFHLPNLYLIELDALENLAPLLHIAPRLETLRLRMSAGFGASVNESLVEALQYVPNLKHLDYSAGTLRMFSVEDEDVVMDEFGQQEPIGRSEHAGSNNSTGCADLLVAIGQTLPQLETLDLRTEWFGNRTVFCSSAEPICTNELKEALEFLPNLRTVSLPSSLLSQPEDSFLRSPIPRPFQLPTSPFPLDPSRPGLETSRSEHIITRRRILHRAQLAERAFISELFDVKPSYRASTPRRCAPLKLRMISLIRQIHEEDRAEYCVEYNLSPNPPCSPRITRPCGKEVRPPSSSATPYTSALHIPASPMPSSLKDWNRSTSGKTSLDFQDLCPSVLSVVAVREVRHYAPVEI